MKNRTAPMALLIPVLLASYAVRMASPALIYLFHIMYQSSERWMAGVFYNGGGFDNFRWYDYVPFIEMYVVAIVMGAALIFSFYALISADEPAFVKTVFGMIFAVSAAGYIYTAFWTAYTAIPFTLLAFFKPLAILATPFLIIPPNYVSIRPSNSA